AYDMAYVRQPVTIRELIRQLNSDESTPTYGDAVGSRHCSFALDGLTRSIAGFPVKWSSGSAYPHELDRARTWMKDESNWINAIRR
ncbi:MAG: hypothetical protein GY820_29715, partial [Gammaproteobacteria bacterium]|nr:hypothetical protein [Gammaproteobacteria bacterium]